MQIPALFDQRLAQIPLDGDPAASGVRVGPQELAARLRERQRVLRALSIEDILGLCDAAAQEWLRPGNPAGPVIAKYSLGFLPLWMRRGNLEKVCDMALRGDRGTIDGFKPVLPGSKRLHRAQPRGLLVHWVAGNVPLLGMISLMQGILSKNANIVKVSHQNAGVLPYFLESLSKVRYKRDSGEVIDGSVLTDATAAVYAPREDAAAARALSTAADVRIAWGGREAVESIMNLPRRYGTEDIVFGPKLSLAIVGAEMLTDEGTARRAARALASDAAALEQRGCNSPHTVFVERGGAVAPGAFAQLLGVELGDICKRLAPPSITAPEAVHILTLRTEYEMRADAWYGDGITWSVLYGEEDRGLAAPCYGRTLFVRPVNDIFDVPPLCSVHTQTAGLAVTDRRTALANALTEQGIERCTEAGRMSAFDNPWDGIYPIDRMVRWVSVG